MPSAVIDGINTRYEVIGSGPPLLMFSPGGFDASLDRWTNFSVYARLKLLDHLPKKYSCITFDRRETGRSGGRVERVRWSDYALQGKGLLDHLNIERAHLMGGCIGCSSVLAFAVAYPQATRSMVHYWPAGGVKYRISTHQRFARHLAYVEENGLAKTVELVKSSDHSFSKDPRGGPWCLVIRTDPSFADAYAKLDLARYLLLVAGMARTMIDRDGVAGAEPEDLLRLDIPALIVPGADPSHATSAARYLEECLSGSDYWDVPVAAQTEQPVQARILEFLDKVTAAGD